MQQFIEYLKDTRAEMKHVSWPTKEQTIAFTALVIVISFTVALLLGVFDVVFRRLFEMFIVK